MDAQLRKETVTMEQVTAHGASQAVVEGEITLPGGLREETHVLHAGGMAVVDSAESGADRATLSGKVIFHVLYTQARRIRCMWWRRRRILSTSAICRARSRKVAYRHKRGWSMWMPQCRAGG